MKYLLCSLLLTCSFNLLNAQSYYLMPGGFFPEKGQMTDVGVFYGKGFDTVKAKKLPVSQLADASLYAGGKPINLLSANKDAESHLSVQLNNSGLCMVTAKKELSESEIDREDVIRQLSDEGFPELSGKVSDKEEMSINNIFALKTLLMAAKPSGNEYSEKTGHDLELVLLQNPYKLKYGEDLTAQILFKGKPLGKIRAEVYTKTLNGTVFPSENISDEDGKIYIKLNRSGDWMIKVINIAPAEKADYNRWCSTYTFGFRSE